MEKNSCPNCGNPQPGKVVLVNKLWGPDCKCSVCGKEIVEMLGEPRPGGYQIDDLVLEPRSRWDLYFMEIANAVSKNSRCLSRRLGAVLVRDRYIIATGYNGPPRSVRHCVGPDCPRRTAGFSSGDGLHLCPAAHAEVNCIATCARLGIVTADTTLYLNWVMPCKNCATMIINAGIKEVVHSTEGTYDTLAWRLFSEGGVEVRRLK